MLPLGIQNQISDDVVQHYEFIDIYFNPFYTFPQFMDQIVSIFEKEKNMIFNERRDLILIDSQNMARIDTIEALQCLHEVSERTIEMVIMPEKTYEKQLMNFNESKIYLNSCLNNPDFTSKIHLEETLIASMTTLDKFKALWDVRDADYFERMHARKEAAL